MAVFWGEGGDWGGCRARLSGARSQGIDIGDGLVLVKVRARAKDGEANEAVLALLADALGVPTSRLHLLRGATGRDKVVRLD